MRFGLKWVAVNSNELKLWENDGTGLKILSRCLPGQKNNKKKITKKIKIAAAMEFSDPWHKMW